MSQQVNVVDSLAPTFPTAWNADMPRAQQRDWAAASWPDMLKWVRYHAEMLGQQPDVDDAVMLLDAAAREELDRELTGQEWVFLAEAVKEAWRMTGGE